MTEIMIRVAGLEELTGALNNLAQAMMGAPMKPQMPQTGVQVMGYTQQSQTGQTFQAVPAPGPVPTAPVPITPPVQPVPTATHTYTLDELARAAMTLMDAGRQGDLLQMLAGFGVEALPALPPEQYGAFATKLRDMGAQI